MLDLLLAAISLSILTAGYLLGRWRPVHRARDWASWKIWSGKDPGYLQGTAIIMLLPEKYAPIIWYRLRHGHYPQRPPRRPAPTPAYIHRRPTEEDTP